MKVAVTGPTGFIGQAVVNELNKNNHDILILSRQKKLLNSKNANFLPFDLMNLDNFPFEQIASVDCLIHLAWQGLPNYQSPHHLNEELPLQFAFLKKCVEAGCKTLLVAGTCFEYGLVNGPMTESLETKPVTQYGLAKDELRKKLQELQKTHHFSLIWPRLFYVWGPGQSKKSLMPMLAEAVERGDQSFPMSLGEQLRDFIYSEDVAKILVKLAMKKSDCGIVNVGTGEPISVRRFVEKQMLAHGWKINLDLGKYPYASHEPLAFWADTTKLKTLIGELT